MRSAASEGRGLVLRLRPAGWRDARRPGQTAAPAVAMCLLLTAACSVASSEGGGDTQPSVTAEVDDDTADRSLEEERAYVGRALSLLEDGYHRTEEVDCEQLRRAAYERLDATPSRAGSYLAISTTLARIGDAHNRLFTPDAVQAFTAERPGELPTVERDGGVLTVTLPPVNLNHDTADDYIAHAFAAIRGELDVAACGWVVDLRGFTGGSMVLPLAVLGPILAGQDAVSVEDADGTVATAVAFNADGSLRWNGLPAADAFADGGEQDLLLPDLDERTLQALADVGPLPSPAPDLPVAVLTSSRTASAAEAVVVALEGRPMTRRFGEATFGVPTGPVSYELEDGAVLRVAERRMVDRNGNAYSTSIPPDVETGQPQADAETWLETDQNCTTGR